MFCRKCGSEILPNAKFCGKCGYQTLEWEKSNAQSVAPVVNQAVQTPVAQPTPQPVQQKSSNSWIAVVIIIVVVALFFIPLGLILIFIGIFSLIPTYEYNSFDYNEYIYVDNVRVDTLYSYDINSMICDSIGDNYSDHIVLEYCTNEVKDEDIDKYIENMIIDNKYTYDDDKILRKSFDDGEVIITIERGDEVTIDYKYRFKSDNSL